MHALFMMKIDEKIDQSVVILMFSEDSSSEMTLSIAP